MMNNTKPEDCGGIRRPAADEPVSRFTAPIPDPQAVVVSAPEYAVDPDGRQDSTAGIQAAIDAAAGVRVRPVAADTHDSPPWGGQSVKEWEPLTSSRADASGFPSYGIVVLPEGTYRVSATIRVWRGIRLIGYGQRRPRLRLTDRCEPFTQEQPRPLVHFQNLHVDPDGSVRPTEANNVTFCSGLVNVDLDLGSGNTGAAAVRFYVAQHSILRHVRMEVNDGYAAVYQAGNIVHDCEFRGGRFGVVTRRTSTGWPTMIAECSFVQQREACVHTDEAGMTVVATSFADAPVGIYVPPGRVEQLHVELSCFHSINFAIEADYSGEPRQQLRVEETRFVGVEQILLQRDAPGRTIGATAHRCFVHRLTHGWHVDGDVTVYETREDVSDETASPGKAPGARRSAYSGGELFLSPLPDSETWLSALDFDALGDGLHDDTAALERALASGHPVYLPSGTYRITSSLFLGDGAVLFGLNPGTTRVVLNDHSSGFTDPSAPQPMIDTEVGATCTLAGIDLVPGHNPGAISVRWRAGARSLLWDVMFDPSDELWQLHREWGRRKSLDAGHSLLVEGNGLLVGCWSVNPLARTGLSIQGSTGGRAYMLSVEHHGEVEVELRSSRNWRFVALQTEENAGSDEARAVRIDDSRDIELYSTFAYRVMSLENLLPAAIIWNHCHTTRIGGMTFSLGRRPFDRLVAGERSEQWPGPPYRALVELHVQ